MKLAHFWFGCGCVLGKAHEGSWVDPQPAGFTEMNIYIVCNLEN